MSGEQEFYAKHRGGSGPVVVVTAVDIWGNERQGIFSSLERAKAWRETLGSDFTCIYAPYVVDAPEWGNEAQQH
jgi:hypothetical protein